MSGLIIGLTIGGAFAGAVGGVATKVLSESGGLVLGIADVFAQGALGTRNMKPPASMATYVLVGTLGGTALGAGAGYTADAIWGGEDVNAPTPIVEPALIQPADLINNCISNAPNGTKVIISEDTKGKPQCIIQKPTF